MTWNLFGLAALALGLVLGGCATATRAAAPTPEPTAGQVYELRTYTTHPGRLPALLTRFRDHTTRIFEKHGMTNVGYWVPQNAPLSENTLIYVLAYPSREAARRSWEAFRNDPEWIRVRDASEADGKIVSKVESVFMDATDFSRLR
jgi:hypothetical protein